jgi:cob(I)alamin adenosyltransferase
MTDKNSDTDTNTDTSDKQREEHKARMQEMQRAQKAKVAKADIERGVLIVNTGDGKGKSSSAFGTAIRAAGHGQRVGILQFIKGTWKTGEAESFKRFPEIEHRVSGDGFTWNTQDLDEDTASARHGWQMAVDMIERCRGDDPAYQLIIFDELNIALRYNYLDINDVVPVLANKPEALSIIVTGRDAKPELIDIADTVTDMTMVKHAFEAGIRAQKGVEF